MPRRKPNRSQPERNSISLASEYDLAAPLYAQFADRVANLIGELVRHAGIPIHSITCRAKTRSSLESKLARPDANYSSLTDLTDLAGVRVTTYFADDVDRVAGIISREFAIDRINSIDKRAALDPDRFGYLSLHHIVQLTSQRCALPEYGVFAGLKAEIQTRSILQHAWAEIEHDLGYKSLADVPRDLRRRFSQLAGLLELADREFQRIRVELDAYQDSLPVKILRSPGAVPYDKESLDAFARQNRTVQEIDEAIAKLLKRKVGSSGNNFHALRRLRALRLTSFVKIEEALIEQRDAIIRIASDFLRRPETDRALAGGISLFYLCYAVGAARGDDALLRMLQKAGVGDIAEHLTARVMRSLGRPTKYQLRGKRQESQRTEA